ncbi:MAG: hypothetical protein WCK29_02625, partial [archaeon]
ANVPVEDTPYPTYNPIPSNDNNSNNNNQRINYSASINDPSVTEILNIGGSNSSSVDGNTKNSFMTDNQVPIIIIVLIVILALIIFLWIFFKLGAAKDDKKPAANNPVTQNNNFKPRPPMQPRPLLVQRPSGNNRPVVQRIQ